MAVTTGYVELSPVVDNERFAPSKLRWFVISIISSAVFVDIYSITAFSYVNNLATAFLRTTPLETDLLSTLNSTARGLTGVLIAIVSQRLTLRRLTLSATSVVPTGCLMIALGISFRTTYHVVVIGQICNGIASAALVLLPTMVSLNWFPESERAIAFSIPWATRRLSMASSSILSTFTYETIMRMPTNTTDFNSASEFTLSTLEGFSHSFRTIFSILSAWAIVAYVLSYIFITSYPPPRPMERSDDKRWSLLEELIAIKKLFVQKDFLIITVNFLFLLAIRPILNVLLSSAVLHKFPEVDDRTPALMYCVAYVGGALGGPTAGFILDRFKRFKLTSAIGMSLCIVACGLLLAAFYIRSILAVYFALAALVCCREFTFVCISNTLYKKVVYTCKLRVVSVYMSLPITGVILYSVAMRAVLTSYGEIVMVGFPIPFLAVGVILLVNLD